MLDLILILLVIIVGGVAIAGVLLIGTQNRLVQLDARCDTAFSDIDVMLKRRHDLMPGLVEVTKGFAGHEREILTKVVEARAAAMRAVGTNARLEAEVQLGQTINSVLAAAEKYPELRASDQFTRLRGELTDSEDRLAGARRYYNLTVEEYNATLRQFPGSYIAQKMRLDRRRPFELGIDRVLMDEPVAVKF